MKAKYFKRIGGFLLVALMVIGVAFVSPSNVQAQHRRRVVVVRPIYRPFGWGWGYRPWGYDPWSPYGSYYRQYVFDNSETAVSQGYKDGFKTGRDDGKKAKSYKPERSHYYHDSGFGNYAEVYRSGFSRGYREGYRAGADQRAG
jgi:hypothetical protein